MKNKIEPIIVTLVNIIARGSHLLFFIAIGNKYGASNITDTVIFLFTPLMVLTAVTASAAEAVVMPAFHKIDNSDTAKYLFLHSIKKSILFVLPSSTLIAFIFSAVAGGLDLLLIMILLPVPLFGSLSALKAGVLNASNRFRVAISGPLFGGILAVTFLVVMPVNVYYFGLSLLLFEVGKLLGIWFFKDITSGGKPIHSDLGSKIAKQGIRNVKLQLYASFILSLIYPIDILFARTLETGSITFVEYVNKLWNIIPLLFFGHIAIKYSEMSKSFNQGLSGPVNIHKLSYTYGAFALIASLFVVFISNHIIYFLYGIGRMNSQQQLILSDLLKTYLLGAGPFVGALVYVRAMSALGRVDLLLIVAILGLIINIICDALFIRLIGVYGIGFATSVVYFSNFLFLTFFYEKIRK